MRTCLPYPNFLEISSASASVQWLSTVISRFWVTNACRRRFHRVADWKTDAATTAVPTAAAAPPPPAIPATTTTPVTTVISTHQQHQHQNQQCQQRQQQARDILALGMPRKWSLCERKHLLLHAVYQKIHWDIVQPSPNSACPFPTSTLSACPFPTSTLPSSIATQPSSNYGLEIIPCRVELEEIARTWLLAGANRLSYPLLLFFRPSTHHNPIFAPLTQYFFPAFAELFPPLLIRKISRFSSFKL